MSIYLFRSTNRWLRFKEEIAARLGCGTHECGIDEWFNFFLAQRLRGVYLRWQAGDPQLQQNLQTLRCKTSELEKLAQL